MELRCVCGPPTVSPRHTKACMHMHTCPSLRMCTQTHTVTSTYLKTSITCMNVLAHLYSDLHTRLSQSLTVTHNSFLDQFLLQHFHSVPRVPGLHRTESSKEQTFVPVTPSLWWKALMLPLLVVPWVFVRDKGGVALKRLRIGKKRKTDDGRRQRETEKGEKKTDRPLSRV